MTTVPTGATLAETWLDRTDIEQLAAELDLRADRLWGAVRAITGVVWARADWRGSKATGNYAKQFPVEFDGVHVLWSGEAPNINAADLVTLMASWRARRALLLHARRYSSASERAVIKLTDHLRETI